MRLVLALAYYMILLIWHRNAYKTRQAIYRIAQAEGVGKTFAMWLLNSDLGVLFVDYQFMLKHKGQARRSDLSLEQYSCDSLSGYADENYNKGGTELYEQQRGLVLPILEKSLEGSHGDEGGLQS